MTACLNLDRYFQVALRMEQQFLFPRAVDESTLFRILLCVCDIVTAKGQCLSIQEVVNQHSMHGKGGVAGGLAYRRKEGVRRQEQIAAPLRKECGFLLENMGSGQIEGQFPCKCGVHYRSRGQWECSPCKLPCCQDQGGQCWLKGKVIQGVDEGNFYQRV